MFLKAADLLAGAYRQRINAATMLGQSKNDLSGRVDSACELIDFLRFNVHFAERIYREQPESSPGTWNRIDHRPLEGFVYAITPFNFTAIGEMDVESKKVDQLAGAVDLGLKGRLALAPASWRH